MSELPGILDISQYIRSDGVKINNSVNIVVGETIIEANGIVLSQLSPVLLELAVKSSDIILDEFVDNVSGVRDCLVLLYGGTVEINDENLETIVKFSIKFEVEKLYTLCVEWIRTNVSTKSTLLFISIGLMAERMGKVDIREICLQNIRDNVKEELLKIRANWCCEDSGTIQFLLQRDILPYSLPVLTAWVQTDANIVLILDDAEVKGITQDLFSQGQRSTDLLNVMSDKVQVLSTSKRIMKLTSKSLVPSVASSSASEKIKSLVPSVASSSASEKMKSLVPSVASSSASEKSLKDLLNEDYNSYSVEKLMATEKYFSLEHYEFVEVLLFWIKINRPSQADVIKLWSVIRQQDLNRDYLECVRALLVEKYKYTIPDVVKLKETGYKYSASCKFGFIAGQIIDALCNDRPVTYRIACERCNAVVQLTVRLCDNTPCYTAVSRHNKHTVKHCYISRRGGYQLLSLITNNLSMVKAELKEDHGTHTHAKIDIVLECI